MEQSEKNEPFVNYLVDYFKDLGIETGLYRYLHKPVRPNDLPKWGIRVFTRRSKFFTLMKKRWYKNNMKIVPEDLVITAKTIAFWFMGDGSTQWRDEHKRKSVIVIHSQGFDNRSVLFLKEKLHQFGIQIIHLQKKPNNGQTLRIERAQDVKRFFNMVEPFILPCFMYKIKYPTIMGRKPYNLIGRR